MEPCEDSIQSILGKIRDRNSAAITELWNAYFSMLSGIADRQMAPGLRRTVDGEDVALSVMRSICRRAETGELEAISERDELWRLMLTLLYHKVADQGRKHRAVKRGGGAVRGDSIFLKSGCEEDRVAFAQFAGSDEAPDMIVQLHEEHQRLLDHLGDDLMREVARRRLDGESADEIAACLNISPRTVRRKLELIRATWAKSVEGLESTR